MTKQFYIWLCKLIADGDVHPFYTSTEWRTVRAKVLEEHHHECYLCKLHGRLSTRGNSTALVVHHVKPLKLYPKLALSPYIFDGSGNKIIQLMPLCHDCHEQIEGRKEKFVKKPDNSKYPERW